MASPAVSVATSADADSNYGSDFSPEELEIVEHLLASAQTKTEISDIEDNPIVNQLENHESPPTLHKRRILGRQKFSPLLQAVRNAEKVADQVNASTAPSEKRKHSQNRKFNKFFYSP